MEKHTPGPWSAYDSRPDDPSQTTMFWDVYIPHRETIAHCNTEANARLVAAAPTLLEACELVIGSLSIPSEDHPDEREVFKRVRAAIAAAQQ